jgi:hypothetical protein
METLHIEQNAWVWGLGLLAVYLILALVVISREWERGGMFHGLGTALILVLIPWFNANMGVGRTTQRRIMAGLLVMSTIVFGVGWCFGVVVDLLWTMGRHVLSGAQPG